MLGWIVALAALAVIGTVVVGLVTGRLDRRAEGCCPSDPAKDLRMRAALDADTGRAADGG